VIEGAIKKGERASAGAIVTRATVEGRAGALGRRSPRSREAVERTSATPAKIGWPRVRARIAPPTATDDGRSIVSSSRDVERRDRLGGLIREYNYAA
jgi:hypothetical protein